MTIGARKKNSPLVRNCSINDGSRSRERFVVERGQYVSFANCGLPYYVGEEIKQREKLIVTSPARLKERFRIDVRVGSNVTEIHRSNKTTTLTDAGTGKTYEESYDKLILSPGASPFKPPIPGIDLPNVLTLRTLGDVDRIKHLVDSGIREAIVIGGGFFSRFLGRNSSGKWIYDISCRLRIALSVSRIFIFRVRYPFLLLCHVGVQNFPKGRMR